MKPKPNKKLKLEESAWEFAVPRFLVSPPIRFPKYSLSTYLFILVIVGFIFNQIFLLKIILAKPISESQNTPKVTSQSTLSEFDQGMIAKLKSEGKTIPTLGTAHNHADITVFINNNQYDFAKPEYYMKSSLIHVDNNQNLKDAGSVLHMNATGVPLSWFFESLNMKLTKDNFTLTGGEVLKNGSNNTLKFYLNGKKVDDLGNYVFQPLDKLLISYGPENDPNIQTQVNSIPNFAKDHQK